VKAGVQIIVETHSDHLFDGIRIYTKEDGHFADNFIGYWFELDKNNTTKWENIQINDAGQFTKEAPKGFCDQFEINAMKLI
jgi:predicted ATPase